MKMKMKMTRLWKYRIMRDLIDSSSHDNKLNSEAKQRALQNCSLTFKRFKYEIKFNQPLINPL